MTFRIFLIINLVSFVVMSCNDKSIKGTTKSYSKDQITEKLLEANKATIIAENDQIDKLVIRNGWQMTETATGLRYEFIQNGNGSKATTGKLVLFEYEVKLLNGEVIYSSEKSGLKQFRLGSGGVESGLEEGMLMMRIGDKVRFIIPSYLAHGLSGDQDKIPSKATLIYIVKLIDIQ